MSNFCSNPNHPYKVASIYCAECKRFYCTECEEDVHEVIYPSHNKIFMQNNATPLAPADASTDSHVMRCKKHRDSPLNYFCKTHFCLCCAECRLEDGDHQVCSTIPFSAVDMGIIRSNLDATVREFETTLNSVKNFPEEILERKQTVYEERTNDIANKIRKAFDEMREVIDRKEAELLGKVEEIFNDNITRISTISGELNDLDEIEEALIHAKEVQGSWDVSNPREMVQKVSDAKESAKKLEALSKRATDVMTEDVTLNVVLDDSITQRIEKNCGVKCTSNVYVPKLKIENVGSTEVTFSWNSAPATGTIYSVYEKKKTAKSIYNVCRCDGLQCTVKNLEPCTEYTFWMKALFGGSLGCNSASVDVLTTQAKCVETEDWEWAECPQDVNPGNSYVTYGTEHKRTAVKRGDYAYSNVIGSKHITVGCVTSWNVGILKSRDGNGIFIGVAPFDIDQNNDGNYDRCGWYFSCYNSVLISGPPHDYRGDKEYGPRLGDGNYVHTGSSIGVVMDTTKGELSFVLNDTNAGVAYAGIPLDKPLVPCVLLWFRNNAVELVV